mmetsp:Transcript_32041/g.78010  ORF Transcript_32041/g.78010 Transcript_32041/m.78010 type:complete len:1375 (-) Transcript_32041:665-4789(-)
MPVTYLELENFKSYGGRHRIGKFADGFTSIIGPNGSGKSNCMDALSFVLGVQASGLRSSQMKDLIFRPPNVGKNQNNLTASASIFYESEDRDGEEDSVGEDSNTSGDDDDDDSSSNDSGKKKNKKNKTPRRRRRAGTVGHPTAKTTTKFQRLIHPNGHGEYRVNNKTVSYKQYEEALAGIGVLVKARNFLVFQGDVETLARKSPAEFVTLIEQISQSIELKPQYDEALKAKDEAEQDTLFCYNKQKGMKGERKQLKLQKEEADRFDELLHEKQKMMTELYLWQVYHLEEDRKSGEERLKELRGEFDEKEEAEKEQASALKEAKKKASAARRATQAADKKRVELANEADKMQPSIIQVEEEIRSYETKRKKDEKSLENQKAKAGKHDETIADLEEQVEEKKEELETLKVTYEAEKQEAALDDQPTLTQEQEEEYEKVKEAAASASVGPRRQLQNIAKQLESKRAEASEAKDALEQRKSQRAQMKRDVTGGAARSKTLADSLAKQETELKSKETELRKSTQEQEASKRRKEEIDTEIEKISVQLRQARDQQRKNRDEEAFKEQIKNMKTLFKGVHGRLADLCQPTQRRFNLAVTVAGGKDMDAIVVDTKETGIECIKYLREQRVGSAQFLPLDNLQTPTRESTERIRARIAQDGRFRLVSDVISCDNAIREAVLYAVENTVICDDLDSARQLCFGSSRGSRNDGQSSIKAVTLGGAVISKAGTMTGGTTRDDVSRAGRWNEKELDDLREKLSTLDSERAKLDSASSSGRQSLGRSSLIDELRNQYDTIRNKINFLNSDLTFSRNKMKEEEVQLKSTERQIPILEQRMREYEDAIQRLSAQQKKFAEDVKAAEDKFFGPFREKTGMTDLKAYEHANRERRDIFNEERRNLSEHIMRLEQQLDLESKRDFTKQISSLEKRLKGYNKKLSDAKAKQKKLVEETEKVAGELDEAEEAMAAASEKETELENEVKEAQAGYKEAQKDRTRVSKAISTEESKLEQLRGKLHETLQKARVEEVHLPLAVPSSQSSRTTRSGQNISALDSDEDMDDEEESQSQLGSQLSSQAPTALGIATQFSQEDNPKVVEDRSNVAKLDFSQLNSALKQQLSDREERQVRKDYEDKRLKIEAELEGLAPNMKAAEQFSNVTDKLKASGTDYEKAKEASRKATRAFQKVKKERTKRFMDCFNHIDAELKTIYTDMTKSSKHPLGGNAYLSLDDTEEPFKGGMKFNAMPPMKRFRDMYQLSGGEKTVASLALLFAIHSYRPAPFFVMDEVDAALDNINLRKVCNYIQQRSQTDFQCIVISLKDMFYERSESLVGICKDVGTNSSRTLTLDLTQYDAKEKAKRQNLKRARAQSEGGVARKLQKALPSSPDGTVTTQ